MPNLISPAGQLAAGRQKLLARSGTGWSDDLATMDLLATVGGLTDQQQAELYSRNANLLQRHVIDRAVDYERVAYRQVRLDRLPYTSQESGGRVVELPHDVLSVEAIESAGRTYENLLDFTQVGRKLLFDFPAEIGSEIAVINAKIRTGDLTNFWGTIFHYYDIDIGADRLYRAIHRAAMTTSSPASFGELLGAVFDVPVVSVAGTVRRVIERPDFGPLVITDQETIAGQVGDMATVEVSDLVQPGDFVFDSLRFHDMQSPPPVWLTSLTVPANYLISTCSGPLTITSTPQPAVVDTVDGIRHLRLPWSGEAADIAAFNAALQAYEVTTGNLLADHVGAGQTTAQLQSANVNWLEVLWSIWLRRGVSVSVVRDRPTAKTLRRVAQLRRAIPPWTTHLVQYLSPPDVHNELC